MNRSLFAGSKVLLLLLYFSTREQVAFSTATDQPQITLLLAISPSSIRVDWDSPDSIGENDTVKYIIQYRNDFSSISAFKNITVEPASQLSYNITNLTAETDYGVRICAKINNGTCVASAELTVKTPLAGSYCISGTDPDYHLLWPATSMGTASSLNCSKTKNSMASRQCSYDGMWGSVDASECQSTEIEVIQEQANTINMALENSTSKPLEDAAKNYTQLVKMIAELLAEIEKGMSLYPADLQAINVILQDALKVFNESLKVNTVLDIDANSIVKVFSDMLDMDNLAGWIELRDDNPGFAGGLLLKNAENYALFLAKLLNMSSMTNLTLSEENIVLKVAALQAGELGDFTFPESKDLITNNSVENAMSDSQITIPSELIHSRFNGVTHLPVANIYFKNLEKFLAPAQSTGLIPGSRIISSQVGETSGNDSSLMNKPVKLNFTIPVENFTNPLCVFWDFNETDGEGSWSGQGLQTIVSSGLNYVVCESTHLTSFAVLVEVSEDQVEPLVLPVISYIGLGVSVFCLLVTMLFFILLCKRTVTSIHFFVHLNLVISLLLAHAIFIAGVQFAVNIEAVCVAVTALLHYFFLASICWMMCEGIMLFLLLLVDFARLSKKWWFFLLIGWLPSLIPVAVTIGIKFDEYGKGVGFCWLSTSSDIIWGLVAPAAFYILVNLVFLLMVLGKLMATGCRTRKKKDKRVELVKSVVKSSLILLPLLVATCAVGILLVNYNTLVYSVIFVVLYSLQGLTVIFFYIICTELVWSKLLCKKEDKKNRPSDKRLFISQSQQSIEKKTITMEVVCESTDNGHNIGDDRGEVVNLCEDVTTFKHAEESTKVDEAVIEKERPSTPNISVKQESISNEEPSASDKDQSPAEQALKQKSPEKNTAKAKRIASDDDLVTKFQSRYYDEDLSFTRTDPRSMKRSATDPNILLGSPQQGIFGSRGGVGLMKLRYDPETKMYLMVSTANPKEKKRSIF